MRYIVPFLIFGSIIAITQPGCAGKPPERKAELGINVAGIAYWTPEIVFADVFKQAQSWTSHVPGKPDGQGGPLDLDPNGWVRKLEGNGQYAEALMFVDLQGHYPAGDYVCLYDGEGEIEFAQAGRVIERKAGRLVVRIVPTNEPICLRLLKTQPGNPVRNIRVLLPGLEKSYRDQPFYPDFLNRWRDFKTVRFMDWGMTNNSPVSSWADRSTPEQATQTTPAGVALEYQIELANALGADPWFCIPHKADDNYIREFARLVQAKLNGDRKIYLEYSNECWRSELDEGRFCAEQGRALGLSAEPYEAQIRYYSQRSVEIFKLVAEIFGGSGRLVRVLSTQPDSKWTIRTVLDWKDAAKHTDAIAVAPYFGRDLGKPANAERTAALTVDQLLDACRADIEANAKTTKEIANLVKGRGLQLIAYEGGQHLVGVEGAENNEKLTNLFTAANRDPRMKDFYLQDLRGWQEAGGGSFCVFSSMSHYMKWGSWGVLESADQDEKSAPKLQAIREFMGSSAP
jgi:hypothetical protein